MDLRLGLDPEFEVSSVRASGLFPELVGAVGDMVVRYDFSAHDLLDVFFVSEFQSPYEILILQVQPAAV